MSTLMPKTCKCSVCSSVNKFMEIASTNTFGGGPDLDLRPAEMMRSTMSYWIQKCPNCGYVSSEVSNPSSVTEEWLKTERFLTCNGISFQSELAKGFYQYYMISLEDGDEMSAFSAVQRAAWACDDAQDNLNAVICRQRAIGQLEKLLRGEKTNQDVLRVVKADLLRRSMLFDQVVKEFASVLFSDDLLNRILAFEIKKAKEQDASCYRVEHVTGQID